MLRPPPVDDFRNRRSASPGSARASSIACCWSTSIWSSKEIAVELGISSHTVDQRIRGALHVLGVERRSQAARMVAQVHGPYQRLIHQPPHIEGGETLGHPGGAVGFQIRHADRAGGAGDLGVETEQRPGRNLVFPAFAVRNEESPQE